MKTKEIDHKSMNQQRKMLGLMTILLVPCSLLFGLLGSYNYPGWYMSVSHTFYANSNVFMIGLLFAIGIYFLSYTGYDWKDRTVSLIEAVLSFCVLVFPTFSDHAPINVGLFNMNKYISFVIHVVAALALFITFAFNLIFIFTISDGKKTKEKFLRNTIYVICGIIILVFTVSEILYKLKIYKGLPEWFPMTMVHEFFILSAFGFSYLVKSGCFKKLNDK